MHHRRIHHDSIPQGAIKRRRSAGSDDKLHGVAEKRERDFRSGVDASATFRLEVRVYYEDTDAGGVVYYANYLKYLERCRTEMLRSLGVDQAVLGRDGGVQFVVASLQVRYLRPARLDDRLTVDATPISVRRCSLRFLQRVWRGDEELARATVTVACVDIRRHAPCRLPASLTARLDPTLRATAADVDLAGVRTDG
jgi:acyl-CoA thioester hydrolase